MKFLGFCKRQAFLQCQLYYSSPVLISLPWLVFGPHPPNRTEFHGLRTEKKVTDVTFLGHDFDNIFLDKFLHLFNVKTGTIISARILHV